LILAQVDPSSDEAKQGRQEGVEGVEAEHKDRVGVEGEHMDRVRVEGEHKDRVGVEGEHKDQVGVDSFTPPSPTPVHQVLVLIFMGLSSSSQLAGCLRPGSDVG
jgi:hypothetical protein